MSQYPYGRKDRLIKEKRHDSYYEKEKPPEPSRCDVCGSLYTGGHWTWKEPPRNARVHRTTCPACRRISDSYPAGTIELKGEFLREHRPEIENLIRNVETQEKTLHPLQRLIEITDGGDRVLVTTTGIHLARRIGEALSRSYKGDLSVQYADEEQSIRVYWER